MWNLWLYVCSETSVSLPVLLEHCNSEAAVCIFFVMKCIPGVDFTTALSSLHKFRRFAIETFERRKARVAHGAATQLIIFKIYGVEIMSRIGPTLTGWTCQGACGISCFESLVVFLRSSEAEGLERWVGMNRISVCRQDCSFVGVCSQSKMHPWTESILAKINGTCDHVFSEHVRPYFTACSPQCFATQVMCLCSTRSDISSDGTAMWWPWKAGLERIALASHFWTKMGYKKPA